MADRISFEYRPISPSHKGGLSAQLCRVEPHIGFVEILRNSHFSSHRRRSKPHLDPSMSLFTSAFETGLNTGPSSSYLANQPKIKSHKRKRPTSHADSSKDDQIRATQRNLEKLMGKVERGDVGSQKDGSEMMGVQIQKKKRKTARADKGKENGQRHGLGKDGLQSGKKQKSKHNEIQQPVKHPAQKHSNKSQGGSGKQKDIQQTIASVPPPTTSDSTVEEGLTFMQKGMRAKLEGARFRYLSSHLSRKF